MSDDDEPLMSSETSDEDLDAALQSLSVSSAKVPASINHVNIPRPQIEQTDDAVGFQLLTKKKPKTIYMKKDSVFAHALYQQKQKEEEEREAVKATTLQYRTYQ